MLARSQVEVGTGPGEATSLPEMADGVAVVALPEVKDEPSGSTGPGPSPCHCAGPGAYSVFGVPTMAFSSISTTILLLY